MNSKKDFRVEAFLEPATTLLRIEKMEGLVSGVLPNPYALAGLWRPRRNRTELFDLCTGFVSYVDPLQYACQRSSNPFGGSGRPAAAPIAYDPGAEGLFVRGIVRNPANRYNFDRFHRFLSALNSIDTPLFRVRFPPAPPAHSPMFGPMASALS